MLPSSRLSAPATLRCWPSSTPWRGGCWRPSLAEAGGGRGAGSVGAARVCFEHPRRRCRVARQLFGRPHRPPHQLAATVGAAPTRQPLARTLAAERAFEGTDQGIGGVGRQILVAAFAIGSELKHRASFSRRRG